MPKIALDPKNLQIAGDLLLTELLKLGRAYKVCPICLLNEVGEAVNFACESGDIEHGIPGVDYALHPIDEREETLQ